MMPTMKQFEYCIKILKTCHLSFMVNPRLVGTYELNKQGNVHLHYVVKCDNINNDAELRMFQRDVANCQEPLRNAKSKRGDRYHNDYMNNIVRLTKSKKEIIEYLMKDKENKIKLLKDSFYCDPEPIEIPKTI